MKKTDVVGGSVLILLAVYLILNKLGMLPDVQWFRLLVTVFMGLIAIKNIPKLNFFGIIMPLCIIGCMYDEQLGIEAITPWTLLASGFFLSIGLGMIFKRNRPYRISVHSEESVENGQDGRKIYLDNSFNTVSKYVNADAFSEAYMENSFGSANVYFNNAIMANGNAKVVLDNSFGEMNIYFPKTWRMELTRDASFGDIKVHGEQNADMDAPYIRVDADCSFGCINIYFE